MMLGYILITQAPPIVQKKTVATSQTIPNCIDASLLENI